MGRGEGFRRFDQRHAFKACEPAKARTLGFIEDCQATCVEVRLEGVIVDSSRNRTLRRIEESRARISKGPEGIWERFGWPNVVAVEGDVLPSERGDMGKHGIVDDLALRA